jgi:hypothetical protein
MRSALIVRGGTLAAAGMVAAAEIQLAALRAAGLNGTAPPHAAAIKSLISTLTNNWIWLVSLGLGLIIVVLAGLLVAGSRTAPDWLFKVIGGILIILVGAPALLA